MGPVRQSAAVVKFAVCALNIDSSPVIKGVPDCVSLMVVLGSVPHKGNRDLSRVAQEHGAGSAETDCVLLLAGDQNRLDWPW